MASEEDYKELFTFNGGDMNVIVKYKGKRVVGKVASQAMNLASPLWKKAEAEIGDPELFDYLKISQPSFDANKKQFICEADNGDTLLIILRVIHLRFADVPKEVDFNALFKLAEFCGKYNCYDLVGPWSDHWIESSRPKAKTLNGMAHKWLYIAWAFTKLDIFEEAALNLLRELPAGSGLFAWGSDIMSQDIVDAILKHRQTIISELLSIPYNHVSRFTQGKSCICKLKSESCDAITYGSLLLQLGRLGFWPEKKASNISWRIKRLAEKIGGLVINTLPTIPGALGEDHSSCVLPFKAEVDKVLASIRSPVNATHLRVNKLKSSEPPDSRGKGYQTFNRRECKEAGRQTSDWQAIYEVKLYALGAIW